MRRSPADLESSVAAREERVPGHPPRPGILAHGCGPITDASLRKNEINRPTWGSGRRLRNGLPSRGRAAPVRLSLPNPGLQGGGSRHIVEAERALKQRPWRGRTLPAWQGCCSRASSPSARVRTAPDLSRDSNGLPRGARARGARSVSGPLRHRGLGAAARAHGDPARAFARRRAPRAIPRHVHRAPECARYESTRMAYASPSCLQQRRMRGHRTTTTRCAG